MFRSALVLAALAIGLVACGSAQAAKPGKHGHSHGNSKGNFQKQGKSLHKGFFHKGRHHKHWSHSRFNSRYHTTFYFDPGDGLWYYWSAHRDGFLPVSDIDDDPPTNDLGPNPDDDDD